MLIGIKWKYCKIFFSYDTLKFPKSFFFSKRFCMINFFRSFLYKLLNFSLAFCIIIKMIQNANMLKIADYMAN